MKPLAFSFFTLSLLCVLLGNAGCLPESSHRVAEVGLEEETEELTPEEQAELAMEEGRFEEAIDLYQSLVETEPEDWSSWANLGYCLTEVDRLDEAQGIFEELIKVPEMKALANYDLACIYSRRQDTEKAFEYLKVAVNNGFRDFDFMENDRDLDFIRYDPRYTQITRSDSENPIE